MNFRKSASIKQKVAKVNRYKTNVLESLLSINIFKISLKEMCVLIIDKIDRTVCLLERKILQMHEHLYEHNSTFLISKESIKLKRFIRAPTFSFVKCDILKIRVLRKQ